MNTVVYRIFKDVLRLEHSQRNTRTGYDLLNGFPIPKWFKAEMTAVCDWINLFREERGLKPITMSDLLDVESMASGHSDYGDKLSLYAAEMSVSDEPIRC